MSKLYLSTAFVVVVACASTAAADRTPPDNGVNGANGGAAAGAMIAAASSDGAPSTDDEATPFSAADDGDSNAWALLVENDLQGLAEWATTTPIGEYAKATQARRLYRSRRERRELERFEQTQSGRFDKFIADAAREWDLDPFLLKGLLWTESRLDPKLVGARIYRKIGGRKVAVGGGARGIAQFTTAGIAAVNEARRKRHREGEQVTVFSREQVWQPRAAIFASAELLRDYVDRFGRDGGITAYNSGPYGGRLVEKHGFFKAKRSGLLRQKGNTALQGYRFLLNVLKNTNRLRRGAGLGRLPLPKDGGPTWLRKLERLEEYRQRQLRRKNDS